MHIGLLAADLSPRHGWGQYGIQLARSLARQGARVTLVAARNSPSVEGITVLPLLPNLVPRQRALPLRLWLARGETGRALSNCQLIHATVEPYAPLARWVAHGRPFLVTGHGSYVNLLLKLPGSRGASYRRAFAGAARVICVSRFTESQLRARLPEARSCVIANGVDHARFADLRHMPADGRPPTVLAVGAIKPRKGILPLVEAIAAARRQIPDLRAVIVGDTAGNPAYVAQVRAAIERHSMERAVQLTGAVDEAMLLQHYAAADLFCLPTRRGGDDFEGFGLVYLEAGLAGLPVIATDAGGVADVVEDGVNGILLPAADVAERLPAALIELLRDREKARQLGEAGRQRALAGSWDAVARRYLAVYEEVLRRQ